MCVFNKLVPPVITNERHRVKVVTAANIIQSFQFKFLTGHKFNGQVRDCITDVQSGLQKSLKCHNAQFCALKALCSIILQKLPQFDLWLWCVIIQVRHSKSDMLEHDSLQELRPSWPVTQRPIELQNLLRYLTLFCSARVQWLPCRREFKKVFNF